MGPTENYHGEGKISRPEQMRKVLRDIDDLSFDFDEAMLNKMHDQIMQEVEQRVMHPPESMEKVKTYFRSHWRGLLYSSSSFVIAITLLSVGSGVIRQKAQPPVALQGLDEETQMVVEVLSQKSDELARTVLTNVSEDEFFVDLALQSNETLSSSKLNKILETN
ncbi:MAG: hypothetical protein ACLGGX_07930 [Bdellovibrionia bacterium]